MLHGYNEARTLPRRNEWHACPEGILRSAGLGASSRYQAIVVALDVVGGAASLLVVAGLRVREQ